MITEIFDESFHSVPADMVICPVALNGLTRQAKALEVDKYFPEIQRAVHESVNYNDFQPGILICLKAVNSLRDQLVTAFPVTPHTYEPISPYYLKCGFQALRRLIDDSDVKRVLIPVEGFVTNDEDPIPDHGQLVSKNMLLREIMLLDSMLMSDEVELILVH
jgi:hypothetical protein